MYVVVLSGGNFFVFRTSMIMLRSLSLISDPEMAGFPSGLDLMHVNNGGRTI